MISFTILCKLESLKLFLLFHSQRQVKAACNNLDIMPHQVALSSSGVSILLNECEKSRGLHAAKRKAQQSPAEALCAPADHHADDYESSDESCPARPSTVIGTPLMRPLIRQGGAVSDNVVPGIAKQLSAPSSRNSKKNKLTFKI